MAAPVAFAAAAALPAGSTARPTPSATSSAAGRGAVLAWAPEGAPIAAFARRDVRAAAKARRPRKAKTEADADAPPPAEVDLTVDEEPDFWEGEQFEVLGKVAGAGLFIIAGLTALVGAYASATYNDGSVGVEFPDLTGAADVDYYDK